MSAWPARAASWRSVLAPSPAQRERRRAVVARGRAPEAAVELERADDALEVALGHRRPQLADDLEVAVAGSHLRAVHHLRAELELAHVLREVHRQLDVAVTARHGPLVAVVELLDGVPAKVRNDVL